MKNNKYLFIPNTLNLEELFPSWKEGKLQRAKWLISTIFLKTEDNEAVRLSSKLLLDYLTWRLYDVIEKLEVAGIIHVSKSYSTAKHECKAYRLADEFTAQKPMIEPLVTKSILKRLLKYDAQKAKKTEANMTESDHQVLKCLHAVNFLVDSARAYAEDNYTDQKYAMAMSCIRQFETREFRYSKRQKIGRLYYNLTAIPKELRRFAILNDNYLWEADLKSFWPSCMVSLARFGERKKLENLIISGKFYEYVGTLINKPLSRDMVKKEFMKNVLFIGNNLFPPLKRRFMDIFPFTMQAMATIKKKAAGDLERCFSQKEAEIIFPIVSQLPFGLTIHDSIATTKDRIEGVQKALEERASALLGFPIKSEVKLLGGREMPSKLF